MKTIETLTTEEERAAAIFRALGNPARVRIVTELARRQACVTELVDVLPLAQSTVSQHLKVLREAGIVRGNVDGPTACYCLNPDILHWLVRFCTGICCPEDGAGAGVLGSGCGVTSGG
ncbi:MAG TPA: metalloregulator ArsR/SmtB family transcription factor [Tepidiformaceae bacterium]|nr:metalloregulator ArsR/SmtB family transcription factor [Tepidiformaceae bacterium]